MVLVRRIGALILVIAAVWVWFNLAPADQPGHGSDRSVINATDDANNATTAGAPQQAVVNGWTNLDYQELISKQLDANASYAQRDDRPAGMLGLTVLGLALLAFTTTPPSRPEPGVTAGANAAQPGLAPQAPTDPV